MTGLRDQLAEAARLSPLERSCCGAADATACHQRGLCWMDGSHPDSPGHRAAAAATTRAEAANARRLAWFTTAELEAELALRARAAARNGGQR